MIHICHMERSDCYVQYFYLAKLDGNENLEKWAEYPDCEMAFFYCQPNEEKTNDEYTYDVEI